MVQDPHHVYLDLDVTNNDYTANKTRPYLRFEEIRNTPFLDGDSAEYFCSIVRFTIQTGNSLPVFIPSIVLNQPDPNVTIYTITLTCEGVIVTRNIAYCRRIIPLLYLRLPCTLKTYQVRTTMCSTIAIS